MPNLHTPSEQVQAQTLVTTPTTGNSTSLNTFGFTRSMIAAIITTAASSTYVVQLQSSPDNATWTNVTGSTFTIAASQTGFLQLMDINLEILTGKYIRLVQTVTGTVSGTVAALLFNADNMPVSQLNPVTVMN